MATALTKVGRYEVVSELGRGSMGVVYQAFDPVIGRMIAIKTMMTDGLSASEFQEYKSRFQREAQAAGVLSHPNIVTVYDFGEDTGLLYLAMEILEGQSLEKIVEAQNILPPDTIIPIFEQVCSALDHAHTHHIVHRDIKPANIMILTNGLVKVTDFGIAKVMSAGMTQAGQILGTPNYMSPEQVKGRPVDGRSDIFSLGVILYELLTGEKPFGGQNITTVIYKIINESPISPRELDGGIHPGLSYITSKALAKSPDERYQTCRELAEDLKNYKNLGGVASPRATVILKVPPAPTEGLEAPPPTAPEPPSPPASTPGTAVDTMPVRPISVQVIPPFTPQPQGTSVATWVVLFLLLLSGAGVGGYYYYFYLPGKSLTNLWKQRMGAGNLLSRTPAPKGGELKVTANVEGAKISLDGRSDPDWLTPHTFSGLLAGPHQVIISREGYEDAEQTALVEANQTSSLNLDLAVKPVTPTVAQKFFPSPANLTSPDSKIGHLLVTSNVDEAKIAIDGKSDDAWLTPYTFDVPPGSHILTLSKESYESVNRSVTVQAGRTTSVSVVLTQPGGMVNIVTIPAGADVTIDNQPMGTSPVKTKVSVGAHTYTAKLPGLPPAEGTFTMENGKVTTKTVTWGDEPVQSTGIVEVRTVPPGATVTADGVPVGNKTPTSFRLAVGHHALIISLQGYANVPREIDVSAEDPNPVKVNILLAPQ